MNSKTIMIVLIAVLGSFVVLLIGVLVALLLFANGSFRFTTTSNKLAVSQTYDQVPTRIQIECLAAEVEVVPGNQVAVDIYGSTEKNNVQMNGDRLVITSTQGENGLFGLFTKGAKIRLTLPGDYSGELQVDCDMGDVEIERTSGVYVTASADVGHVKIYGNDESGTPLDISCQAGSVEVNQ